MASISRAAFPSSSTPESEIRTSWSHEAHAGILIDDFNDRDFEGAWAAIQELVNDPNIKAKVRVVAEKMFDLNVRRRAIRAFVRKSFEWI